MKGLGKLTYELPSTNILNQVTLEHQYTYSMMEEYHTCAYYFSFILFYFILFYFILFYFILFYFYIYTNVHTLNINKISPKDDINNG